MTRKRLMLIVAVMLIALAACKTEQEEIVIASKPMTEQYILSEMLEQLITDRTDLSVVLKQGIGGGTSNIHPGMISGEIDIYPEYTGTGWLFVLKREGSLEPDALYRSVKEEYASTYGIYWSGLYGFNDTFGLAMKESLAEELGISTYSDLADHSSTLSFGAEYDFYEREDGMPGLKSVYGFDFKNEVELDIGLKYQAIASDEVDVINVFSTDGRLKENNLTVLKDDALFFPDYHAATLIRQEVLDKHPELEEVIELLTGQISNEEMIRMNYAVEILNEDPKQVAREFLLDKGLID